MSIGWKKLRSCVPLRLQSVTGPPLLYPQTLLEIRISKNILSTNIKQLIKVLSTNSYKDVKIKV